MVAEGDVMVEECEQHLVVHRMKEPEWRTVTAPRQVVVYECPDPCCSGEPGNHELTVPCRWSWPYAHGKTYNGESFPKRRCPGCAHIGRAGSPQVEIRQKTG